MTEFVSFAQRIRIRLFLEGIEIPVISAQVTAAPNSPSMGVIQIPPLVEGTRLFPRTIVHVFFQDAYASANPFLLETPVGGKSETDETNPDDVDSEQMAKGPDEEKQTPETPTAIKAVPCGDTTPKEWSNRRFKLMFGGEVVGFAWTKTPMNRSLILQCEDFSNYWDYAYQWSNTGIFGPGQKAIFSGGATNLFTDFLSSKGSMLTSIIIQGKCNTFPKLRGLAAGIVRLVESIGGSYYTRPKDSKGNAPRKFGGQNIFFSLAELRLHITQMIAAFEVDPTSKKLLARSGYGGMFNRALGGLGQQVSIRKAMNAITKIMFHEMYPQPCPMYKPGKGTDPAGTRRVRIASDPRLAFFVQQAVLAMRSIDSLKNDLTELREAAAANAEGGGLTGAEFSKVVRDSMRDSRSRIHFIVDSLQKGKTEMKSRDAPDILVSIYAVAIKALKTAERAASRWRPGLHKNNYWNKTFEPKLDEAVTQLRRVPELTINTVPLKEIEPARLVQQILRPDIWFGSPPRCNVLFPDMYEQLSYRRAFLQEPTRFLLKVNDEFFGEDFLFDRFYFAPQAGSLRKTKANLRDVLKNDILDHELFTGILPVFEKMGEFNVFAARSNRGQKVDGKVVKVSFAQRSANFIYFKHRFNSRQFQVSGRFNPYVACGFPGVIIDRWVDQQQAERIRQMREAFTSTDEQARNLLLPKYTAELIGANYLVNFTEVTHQCSQEQLRGNTTIRCTYARQPSEDVAFLGVADDNQTVQKRQEGDANRTTDVAAIDPPALYAIGPNQGRIVNRREVTEKYISIDKRQAAREKALTDLESGGPTDLGTDPNAQRGKKLPVFFGGARRSGGTASRSKAEVPIGVPVIPSQIGGETGNILAEMVGNPYREIIFRAFAIDEEVPRYKLEVVDLPAEELIRPGWYGDVWSPAKIGEVYKDFFGIGSITEPTAVLDAAGKELTQQSETLQEAQEAADDAENVEDANANLPVVTSLGEKATIEQAVEFLTLTYSYVKQANMDSDEFIRAYTWRPIASLIDMFGTEGLTFNENGTAVVSKGEIEGFHSRAFGPYNDVFGLVAPEIETLIGIKRGTTVAQKGDTRKRKFEAVSLLAAALNFSRAQIG
jgi:hypothetical protein